jgi:CRISPR/Cas system-associated endonuclease Cas1
MKPLLLTTYGLTLKTRDRRLVLWNQDSGERKEWLPTEFTHDSIIAENLGGFVTFPALRWLASNGVSLTMLDFNGSVLGAWLPDYPLNAANRLAQMEAFYYRRLPVARFILENKLGRPVPEPRSINDLLMYEAREAEQYWTALGIVRDYPHARDAANACLNYAFGLLESRARLAAHRASLEPSLGFLHEWREHKPSLVFDLQEPFRALTAEVALTVKRELTSRDFGEVFGHGLKLRPEGARRLVTAFARRFNEQEMGRFVSRLILRFQTAEGREAPSQTGRQTEGRMVPRRFSS